MRKAFLDTSYAIALAASTDQWHQRAIQLAKRLKADQTKIITTQAILLEIGNSLSNQRHRRAAISLLESLENDPTGLCCMNQFWSTISSGASLYASSQTVSGLAM